MTHSRHPGIFARWKLKIDRKHYVEVFVWSNKESMYAADDYNTSFKSFQHCPREHDFDGFARALGWSETVGGKHNGRRRSGKKFGEIHLVRDLYGGGVFAHELAHMVNYWSNFKRWDRSSGIDDEKSAYLTGAMTAEFWREHYKVFK